jgi:hypothetical protein
VADALRRKTQAVRSMRPEGEMCQLIL